MVWSAVWVPGCTAQASPQNAAPAAQSEAQSEAAMGGKQAEAGARGTIHGMIVDQSGALVAGAAVQLVPEYKSQSDQSQQDQSRGKRPAVQETLTDGDGQFTFDHVESGPFRLTITAPGFSAQTITGELASGETATLPAIVLAVAASLTQVEVGLPRIEIAEEQIKVEEKQRVFGAIPNFFVSYVSNAVPLTPGQKFNLAWKTVIDPVTILITAGGAGVKQAEDKFNGYGQGAQGYAKRFGAGYADAVQGTLIGSAILPSVLKQDPRYFYKGRGSKAGRFFYAVANAFICKGDNGYWQPNYSSILGSLAAGGISNLYYPAQNRGMGLTLENAGIGIGGSAIANVFQEFIVRKLTPKTGKADAVKP